MFHNLLRRLIFATHGLIAIVFTLMAQRMENIEDYLC